MFIKYIGVGEEEVSSLVAEVPLKVIIMLYYSHGLWTDIITFLFDDRDCF